MAIVAVACSAVSIPINPKQTIREIEACLEALKPNAVLLMNSEPVARQAAERRGLTIIEAIPSKDGISTFDRRTQRPVEHGEPDEPDLTRPRLYSKPQVRLLNQN